MSPTATSPDGVKPFERRFNAQRQEYQNRLPLTTKVQADLREDVDALRAQEGWDLATQEGVDDWVGDLDNVFHALRRNRWDPHKTHAFLLAALHQRITRRLHEPIHTFPEYSSTTLFHILPLPTFRDRVNRPIAVITLNQVHRDEHGHLDDLKEWTWWAMEMVRRTLRDWWLRGGWTGSGSGSGEDDKGVVKKRRGTGGEGIVVIVDATKAGYRNLEVDLLPTLLACGHNNFPGMMEAVYIVNAGWTHRSMWGVIKRLLPKTTLEKVNFLENRKMLEEIFDLDRLPKTLGGNHDYTFDSSHNIMLSHYALRSSKTSATASASTSDGISRSASCSSIADVYFSAPNSPFHSRAPSRHASRRGSLSNGLKNDALRMTTAQEASTSRRTRSANGLYRVPRPSEDDGPEDAEQNEEGVEVEVRSPFEEQFSQAPVAQSRRSSTKSSPRETPIQRIKSLSNFHLYLSPSRLAHIDLLNDSDSDDDSTSDLEHNLTHQTRLTTPDAAPLEPPRKILKPAVVDPDATVRDIASRRSRPPLRLFGGAADEVALSGDARSYSDDLGLHHAKLLQQYRHLATVSPSNPDLAAGLSAPPSSADVIPALQPVAGVAVDASPPSPPPPPPLSPSSAASPPPRSINAYSRSSNPWFGYPALLVPDPDSTSSYAMGGGGGAGRGRIVPRYSRRRKRDLVKTLLFLFMIRLQSLRDTVERSLGLYGAGPSSRGEGMGTGMTPGEGLVLSANRRGTMGKMRPHGKWGRDWVWWIVGFLVLRGTWVRLLAVPLELLGLESVRDFLGLV